MKKNKLKKSTSFNNVISPGRLRTTWVFAKSGFLFTFQQYTLRSEIMQIMHLHFDPASSQIPQTLSVALLHSANSFTPSTFAGLLQNFYKTLIGN
jgi:hypothetical protein